MRATAGATACAAVTTSDITYSSPREVLVPDRQHPADRYHPEGPAGRGGHGHPGWRAGWPGAWHEQRAGRDGVQVPDAERGLKFIHDHVGLAGVDGPDRHQRAGHPAQPRNALGEDFPRADLPAVAGQRPGTPQRRLGGQPEMAFRAFAVHSFTVSPTPAGGEPLSRRR